MVKRYVMVIKYVLRGYVLCDVLREYVLREYMPCGYVLCATCYILRDLWIHVMCHVDRCYVLRLTSFMSTCYVDIPTLLPPARFV